MSWSRSFFSNWAYDWFAYRTCYKLRRIFLHCQLESSRAPALMQLLKRFANLWLWSWKFWSSYSSTLFWYCFFSHFPDSGLMPDIATAVSQRAFSDCVISLRQRCRCVEPLWVERSSRSRTEHWAIQMVYQWHDPLYISLTIFCLHLNTINNVGNI